MRAPTFLVPLLSCAAPTVVRGQDAAIETELHYTLDTMASVAGGVKRANAVLGNVDLMLTADMERLLGWSGGTLFLHGLASHGDSISASVGDLQGVDNIEAPETVRLYEAWYEHATPDGRLSLLFGLYDVNSEFDVLPAGGLFVHSAHGMGSALGTSGVNGPSTFPVTSLSARLHWKVTERAYLRAVVADGVPGDPLDPEGTHVDLDPDDGLFLAAEVGFYEVPSEELRGRTRFVKDDLPAGERHYGYFGKYAVGVWGYTTDFDAFPPPDGVDPLGRQRGTSGVYGLAEQTVYYEEEDPSQGLGAFLRLGVADDGGNVFDRYAGFGLVYRGPIPSRDDDQLGFAVAAARLGAEARATLGSPATEDWEVAYELTYRARVTPWLSVQPELQYVVHPGGDPLADDALVVGLRAVVSL